MTITVIYSPESQNYTGLVTYPIGFESIGAEALEIWAVDASGNRTYLPPSDYTSLFYGDTPIYDGGEFTMTVPPPVGTVSLSIERNTPITQLVDFQPYGRFGANIVEFALDKLTMICQEIDARKCNKVDQLPTATGITPNVASL